MQICGDIALKIVISWLHYVSKITTATIICIQSKIFFSEKKNWASATLYQQYLEWFWLLESKPQRVTFRPDMWSKGFNDSNHFIFCVCQHKFHESTHCSFFLAHFYSTSRRHNSGLVEIHVCSASYSIETFVEPHIPPGYETMTVFWLTSKFIV